MNVEEIKKMLMENPSVLVSKPEIIYLAKLTPWQNLATRNDIKRLEERMAIKGDLNKLEERLSNVERNIVTKEEAKNFLTKYDAKKFCH